MLCDKCHKREAKVYYTEIINGEKKEQHLCEECAAEYTNFQLRSKFGNKEISLGGVLSSILNNYYSSQLLGEEKVVSVKCNQCGMTYENFLQEGRFGCASCYRSFGKQIENSFRQIHGATTHIGKRPKGFVSEMDQIVSGLTKVERLSILLQDAIEKEEFEEAARLRDEIREWKAKEESKNA